jgi:hypothetical protein
VIRALATIAFWLACLSPLTARGQAAATLPLGEHYRVGKFFPVRATSIGDAAGAMPTRVIPGSSPNDAVVPLLAVGTIQRDGWLMRPLRDDERLVAATSADPTFASQLFPGQRVIDVPIDLAAPLPGPTLAWQALDAVLLDAPAAARVSERQVETLLAGGTTVAVRSDARPRGAWPWRQQGAWWVVRSDAPHVELVQSQRYAPGVESGTPAHVRRTIAFVLAAFALAAVGASLWRSRWAWGAVVLLAVVAGFGLAAWHSRQPTNATFSSDESSGMWRDRWTRYTAFADGEVRHEIIESDAAAWPVFFSRRQAQDADLHLECAADGMPQAFVGKLKRGQSIVFLNRSLTPTPAAATSPAAPPR